MRAVVLRGPGELVFDEHADPSPSSALAVVTVRAAGLNPVDLTRMSEAALPSIPGNEGVGELDGAGRVYFERTVSPFGSFAQRALVEAARPIPIPDALEDGQALSLGIAGLAGWLSVERTGMLARGERVLVLGASGAVGHVAVQAARLLGAARVVAAARDRTSLDSLRALGADETVALGADDAAALLEAAHGGFDLVIDPLYGAPLVAALAATAPGARVVSVGASAAATATIPRSLLYGRSLLSHGNRTVPAEVKRDAYRRMVAHVLAGELVPFPSEAVPMERFAEAFARQRSGAHAKLILVPPDVGAT
jgi:NADPH:quinone reductase-like Zn-dependent oxidoreductase